MLQSQSCDLGSYVPSPSWNCSKHTESSFEINCIPRQPYRNVVPLILLWLLVWWHDAWWPWASDVAGACVRFCFRSLSPFFRQQKILGFALIGAEGQIDHLSVRPGISRSVGTCCESGLYSTLILLKYHRKFIPCLIINFARSFTSAL